MNNAPPKTVLWPDLGRFGVSLTVATNPSLARNFLKFTIKDRALFTATSGFKGGDIYQIMRDAGFAYAASEARSKSERVYDDTVIGGSSESGSQLASTEAQSQLYFYSPSIHIRKELIQQFVPAVEDKDFQQIPIAEIKHFDHNYLTIEQVANLTAQQQGISHSDYGVFYTIPHDREVIRQCETSKVSLNELLSYQDFPPQHVAQRSALTPQLAEIASFNSLRAVERVMVGQTLGLDGLPLKAPRPSATIIAYATYEEAVAANGGDVETIERVQYPFALPIAFDYPKRRLLVLKDARYLEVPNTLYLPGKDDTPRNTQSHWTFLNQMESLIANYQTIRNAGLLEEENWENSMLFEEVSKAFSSFYDAMKIAAKPFRGDGFLDHADMIKFTGLRVDTFDQKFPKDFLTFLGQFKNTLYTAMMERKSSLIAAQALANSARPQLPRSKPGIASLESRREDAGEKIGGARKDYHKRWLSASEISSLSVREMINIVTKDNVWPPLDYEAMRKLGVEPVVARAIKEFRHALPVNPLRGGNNRYKYALKNRAQSEISEKMSIDFVSAVTLVRDALANVKTRQELLNAVYSIRKAAVLELSIRTGGMNGSLNNEKSEASESFADGAGYKFRYYMLPSVTIVDGRPISHMLTRLLLTLDAKIGGNKWDWCIREKDDLDEGKTVAKEKKDRPEPEVPHLEHIERVGFDYRNGKNVDENMLMETFGFRAIEYGNWLVQRERQLVLNHTYDAFMDLAEALRLPPTAMSLGRNLAVAFGSRGRGGKSAALAHYEPSTNTINLTRMNGAGALAHEWAHGFDYFVAKEYGVSNLNPVTKTLSFNKSAFSAVVNGITTIVNEASGRYRTREEMIRAKSTTDADKGKVEHINDHLRSHIMNWIAALDRHLPEEQQQGAFKLFAVTLFENHLKTTPELEPLGALLFCDAEEFVRLTSEAIDAHIGTQWRSPDMVNMKYPIRVAQWYEKRVNNLVNMVNHWTPTSHLGASTFREDAEYYDSFRSKPYWATREELFARAFESWVQDRVQSIPGNKSQYLVFGRDDNPDAQHSGYPRGTERVMIAKNMEKLFYACGPELIRRLGVESDIVHKTRVGNEIDLSM